MKSKRSRLALVGAMALALSVTVGLVSGSAADAKKKHKKGSVTVSRLTPTTIPTAASANGPVSQTTIPLKVGKKAKGKVVGWDTLTVTSSFTGSAPTALRDVSAKITAPNGRTARLVNPEWNGITVTGVPNTQSGPLTETPNSPFNSCFPTATQPCPGGAFRDPEATVGPPYVGTIGNINLAWFGGVPAKGIWTVKVFNSSTTTTARLSWVRLRMHLRAAPAR